MLIQKYIGRRVGEKKYYKFKINIPLRIMNELEWNEKTEVNMEISGKKIIIEKI